MVLVASLQRAVVSAFPLGHVGDTTNPTQFYGKLKITRNFYLLEFYVILYDLKYLL